MNQAEFEAWLPVFRAHWPHTPLDNDSFDTAVLRAAIQHLTLEEATAAMNVLVHDGLRFQPRAPEILAAYRRVAAEESRRRRDEEAARALMAGDDFERVPGDQMRELVECLRGSTAMP